MERKIISFIFAILTFMSVSIALNVFMLLELNEESDKYNAKIANKNLELKVLTNQFDKLQKTSSQFNELQKASEDTIDNLLTSIKVFNDRINITSALNNNYREKLTKLFTPIWLGTKESESFRALCNDFGMATTDCNGRTLFDIVTNSNAVGNAIESYADNYNLYLCPH